MSYEQIISPKSKRKIYLYGDAYEKLKPEYSEDYLLSLPRYIAKKPPKSPKIKNVYIKTIQYNDIHNDLYFPEDVMSEILLNSNIDTIHAYCVTNKNNLCQNDEFWKLKFQHDHLPILDTHNKSKDWINMYKKMIDIINEIDIILKIIKNENVISLEINTRDNDLNDLNLNIPHINGLFYIYFENKLIYISQQPQYMQHTNKVYITEEELKNILINILYTYGKHLNIDSRYNKAYASIPIRKFQLENYIPQHGMKFRIKNLLKYYNGH